MPLVRQRILPPIKGAMTAAIPSIQQWRAHPLLPCPLVPCPQKVDAGCDDLRGCNRWPASERRDNKWFNSCLSYVENQGNELKGPFFYLFSGRVVVPQGPVKPTCCAEPYLRLSRFLVLLGATNQARPKSIPVRCVKEPNWVHCQESRRRKKQSGLSIPERGTLDSGELRGRPGYSDAP